MSDFAGFDVGARIGVWRVSGFLGGGLTGEVYLVDETVAPFRRGALKYCRFADDGHRKKFSDEIDIAEARPVPGALPEFYARGTSPDGAPYYVMEVARRPNDDLPAAEAAAFVFGVIDAVELLLASDWIHGDLKPENFGRTDDGRIVLVDYGSVRRLAEAIERPPAYTPRYAAPETIGDRKYNEKTLVHAIATALDEMTVPDERKVFAEAFRQACNFYPQKRPDLAAFKAVLRECLAEAKRNSVRRLVKVVASSAAVAVAMAVWAKMLYDLRSDQQNATRDAVKERFAKAEAATSRGWALKCAKQGGALPRFRVGVLPPPPPHARP